MADSPSRSRPDTAVSAARDGFWDKGSFYQHVTDTHVFGIEANADEVGLVATGVVGTAIAAHAAVSAVKAAQKKGGDNE